MPVLFNDKMVLQQNEDVSLWGKDRPGIEISIIGSWGSRASAWVAQDSTWSTRITTREAGGPYTLTIQGSDKINFIDVLLGEVWLCSGQSNMRWIMQNTSNEPAQGSNKDILYSGSEHIRIFQTQRRSSSKPLEKVNGEWFLAKPSTVWNVSAVAYLYGEILEEILDVPVGLIVTCWGGSAIEAKMEEKAYAQFGYLTSAKISREKGNKIPSNLYNAIVHPFIPYKIKGVIWYQREANVRYLRDYKILFPAMIRSWREDWQQGDFPFYFVQITPYMYGNSVNYAFMREAQLYTMQHVENTGMAVTLDIGDCDNIHPKNKKTVAERLVYWALAKTYDVGGIKCTAPVYKSMEPTGDGEILLTFEHTTAGFTGFGEDITGFTIAGEDKVFHPAQIKIMSGQSILV